MSTETCSYHAANAGNHGVAAHFHFIFFLGSISPDPRSPHGGPIFPIIPTFFLFLQNVL